MQRDGICKWKRGGGGVQLEDEEAHATGSLLQADDGSRCKENRTKDKKGKQRGEGEGRGRRPNICNATHAWETPTSGDPSPPMVVGAIFIL